MGRGFKRKASSVDVLIRHIPKSSIIYLAQCMWNALRRGEMSKTLELPPRRRASVQTLTSVCWTYGPYSDERLDPSYRGKAPHYEGLRAVC